MIPPDSACWPSACGPCFAGVKSLVAWVTVRLVFRVARFFVGGLAGAVLGAKVVGLPHSRPVPAAPRRGAA